MFSCTPDNQDFPEARSVALPFTEDVAELSLLLPAWQVSALEQAAHTNGLTTAAMLRRLIEEFFGRSQRIMEKNARQWA